MIHGETRQNEKADLIVHTGGQDMQNVLRTRFMTATVITFILLFGKAHHIVHPAFLQL